MGLKKEVEKPKQQKSDYKKPKKITNKIFFLQKVHNKDEKVDALMKSHQKGWPKT